MSASLDPRARIQRLWGGVLAPSCQPALAVGDGAQTCNHLLCVLWCHARRMSDAPWTPEQREWAVREVDANTPVRDLDDLRTWSDRDLADEVLSSWT